MVATVVVAAGDTAHTEMTTCVVVTKVITMDMSIVYSSLGCLKPFVRRKVELWSQ